MTISVLIAIIASLPIGIIWSKLVATADWDADYSDDDFLKPADH